MPSLSENGFRFLKNEESYERTANVHDGERCPTVGIGHYSCDLIKGRTYSDSEIMNFFKQDSARFNADVNKVFKTGMSQNQFDAMFSFAYNHGNISQTELGQVISKNPNDFNAIVTVWKRSYTNGSLLLKRRERESNLYCGGDYGSLDSNSADQNSDAATEELLNEQMELRQQDVLRKDEMEEASKTDWDSADLYSDLISGRATSENANNEEADESGYVFADSKDNTVTGSANSLDKVTNVKTNKDLSKAKDSKSARLIEDSKSTKQHDELLQMTTESDQHQEINSYKADTQDWSNEANDEGFEAI